MQDKFAGIEKIIVLNKDNVIIDLLCSAPAYAEYEEHGKNKKVILDPITSIKQLLDSLPAEIVYVRLNDELQQIDSGVLNLTCDNYKAFVSDKQAIRL